jgi:hypothetical protein
MKLKGKQQKRKTKVKMEQQIMSDEYYKKLRRSFGKMR